MFHADDIEVPAEWSQVACDVLAQKYFRKAGIPARLKPVEEEGVPVWLWRHAADEAALQPPEAQRSGGETQAKQVFDRLAGTWTYWGWKGGYFDGEADARAFYDEMRLMLAARWGRPTRRNGSTPASIGPMASTGPAQGHYYVDYRTGKVAPRSAPTSTRSRTPASSSRSPTISSTRAASWTCGCARRGCSNTARAPAPISRSSAATASACRAAAAPPA